MARVVLVLPNAPLPFGNAAARWFYVLVKGLVERGHELKTLVVVDSDDEIARTCEIFPRDDFDLRFYRPPMRTGLAAKLETIRKPFSYLIGPDLKRDLATLARQGIDVLHLEQLWSGWVGFEHAEKTVLNIHYLYEIDLSDTIPDSIAERFRRFATRRGERGLLRGFPNITTLTDRLTKRVQEISPMSNVQTVPLGMDLSLYPFESRREVESPRERAPVVGLIGSFNWSPTYKAGVRLLTRLWPEIKKRAPEARLQIVGRSARSALGGLPNANGPDVELAENVPDTIPYFRAIDALVYAPGRGSGMKVKVLEALALGVPVVTTFEGVEGLDAIDGVHATVRETDAELVDQTVALLLDPNLRERRRIAGRALVEATCSPNVVLDRLETVYDAMSRQKIEIS